MSEQKAVIGVMVYCHIGSLETKIKQVKLTEDCLLPHRQLRKKMLLPIWQPARLLPHSSLENKMQLKLKLIIVYCHIGSLEISLEQTKQIMQVYCHIGSLEKKHYI